jgi:hypothetical protein
MMMTRIDGTSARQLDLFGPDSGRLPPRRLPDHARPMLKLLRQDIYAELTRRRRRAQVSARHRLEGEN